MSLPSPRLAALGDLVARAGAIAQAARAHLVRELKPDGSIVTNGDREVETALRAELPALVPGTAVWGEEFGFEAAGSAGLWVVDPVDGTSNYAFGSPLWGVSVALVQGPQVVLGAVALPDLGELYLAERGGGAYRNGQPLPPIPPGPVQPEELVTYHDSLLRHFPDFTFPGKMRLSGAFVIDGTFVACQRFRGLIGSREKLYDIAACVLLGQELGADVRYADGSPFDIAALAQPVAIRRPWLVFPRDSGFLMSAD